MKTDQLKILILVPGLPVNTDDIKGGVHSAVINLVKGFEKMPVQVRVLSLNNDIDEAVHHQYSSNVELLYVPEGKYGFHSFNYFLTCPAIIKNNISSFNPDIVHYEEGNSFLLTRFFGLHKKPYLLTIHGMAYAEARLKKSLKDKVTFYYNGFIQTLMFPKNIIHICRYSLNLFKNGTGTNYSIIPNAINSAYFNLPVKDKTDNHLLYIGAIDERKNLLFALKALKKLREQGKNYKLNVLGGFLNETYEQQVKSFIAENDLHENVFFIGWAPQPVVQQYIANADILILPSLQETLPMVIAECLAAGKVVASTAVGGIPEMIRHNETGFLFDKNDPQELETLLTELYDNNEKIKQVSLNARAEALATYQSEAVAAKTIEFYNSILRKK